MEQNFKLPALRDSSQMAEFEEKPGLELLDFLKFLRSEAVSAISIMREETQEALQDGDPWERIQTIGNLKLKKRKLEQHIRQELQDVREIIESMKGREDKTVIATLQKEIQDLVKSIGAAIQVMQEEFGI
jgi:hypothetical protein